MSTNRISETIPEDVVSQVKTALGQVETLLQPYLQSLTNKERRRIAKMGDDSFSFVNKVNDYCQSNPEFCPGYVDIAELGNDFSVVDNLKPLLDKCEQICSNIDDTVMLAGSEAYTASLLYYGNVQTAAKRGEPNAKPIFDDLHQRFVRKPKNSENGTGKTTE